MCHRSPFIRWQVDSAIAAVAAISFIALFVSLGELHRLFRDSILKFGQKALDGLVSHEKVTEDWREKLLCEALALRLSDSESAEAFDAAGRFRTRGFWSKLGPRLDDYKACGEFLATATGDRSIQLIEAAVAFNADTACANIAVFALAHLKLERSKIVIKKSIDKVRFAADALEVFAQ